VVIRADPLSPFRACRFAGGFGNGAFAMHPVWFNAIEPETLARKPAHPHATAPGMLEPLVRGLHPGPHAPRRTCHEALSQTTRSACLPSLANRAANHPRNWLVSRLTGRPSTKRISMALVSTRHKP